MVKTRQRPAKVDTLFLLRIRSYINAGAALGASRLEERKPRTAPATSAGRVRFATAVASRSVNSSRGAAVGAGAPGAA